MTLLSWFRGSVPPRYPIAKEAADDGGKRIAIPPRDLQKSVRYKGLGEEGERVEKERKILCILETRSRAVADFSKKIFRI